MAVFKKGFTPSRRSDGGANSNALTEFQIRNGYATNIFHGDPVKVSAGFAKIATNTEKVIGVAVGFYWADSVNKNVIQSNYFPANTSSAGGVVLEGGFRTPVVKVAPARDNTFLIPADSSVATSVVGTLYPVSIGTGSSFTGQSGAVIHVSAVSESSIAQSMIRVVGIATLPDNAVTDSAPVLEVEFSQPGYDS